MAADETVTHAAYSSAPLPDSESRQIAAEIRRQSKRNIKSG